MLELVELTRGVVRLGRGTHIVDVQPVIPLPLEVEPGRDARGAGAQTERSTEADAGTVVEAPQRDVGEGLRVGEVPGEPEEAEGDIPSVRQHPI